MCAFKALKKLLVPKTLEDKTKEEARDVTKDHITLGF